MMLRTQYLVHLVWSTWPYGVWGSFLFAAGLIMCVGAVVVCYQCCQTQVCAPWYKAYERGRDGRWTRRGRGGWVRGGGGISVYHSVPFFVAASLLLCVASLGSWYYCGGVILRYNLLVSLWSWLLLLASYIVLVRKSRRRARAHRRYAGLIGHDTLLMWLVGCLILVFCFSGVSGVGLDLIFFIFVLAMLGYTYWLVGLGGSVLGHAFRQRATNLITTLRGLRAGCGLAVKVTLWALWFWSEAFIPVHEASDVVKVLYHPYEVGGQIFHERTGCLYSPADPVEYSLYTYYLSRRLVLIAIGFCLTQQLGFLYFSYRVITAAEVSALVPRLLEWTIGLGILSVGVGGWIVIMNSFLFALPEHEVVHVRLITGLFLFLVLEFKWHDSGTTAPGPGVRPTRHERLRDLDHSEDKIAATWAWERSWERPQRLTWYENLWDIYGPRRPAPVSIHPQRPRIKRRGRWWRPKITKRMEFVRWEYTPNWMSVSRIFALSAMIGLVLSAYMPFHVQDPFLSMFAGVRLTSYFRAHRQAILRWILEDDFKWADIKPDTKGLAGSFDSFMDAAFGAAEHRKKTVLGGKISTKPYANPTPPDQMGYWELFIDYHRRGMGLVQPHPGNTMVPTEAEIQETKQMAQRYGGNPSGLTWYRVAQKRAWGERLGGLGSGFGGNGHPNSLLGTVGSTYDGIDLPPNMQEATWYRRPGPGPGEQVGVGLGPWGAGGPSVLGNDRWDWLAGSKGITDRSIARRRLLSAFWPDMRFATAGGYRRVGVPGCRGVFWPNLRDNVRHWGTKKPLGLQRVEAAKTHFGGTLNTRASDQVWLRTLFRMVRAERVMEHALARAEMRERSLLETRRYIRAGLQEKAEKEEQMFAEWEKAPGGEERVRHRHYSDYAQRYFAESDWRTKATVDADEAREWREDLWNQYVIYAGNEYGCHEDDHEFFNFWGGYFVEHFWGSALDCDITPEGKWRGWMGDDESDEYYCTSDDFDFRDAVTASWSEVEEVEEEGGEEIDDRYEEECCNSKTIHDPEWPVYDWLQRIDDSAWEDRAKGWDWEEGGVYEDIDRENTEMCWRRHSRRRRLDLRGRFVLGRVAFFYDGVFPYNRLERAILEEDDIEPAPGPELEELIGDWEEGFNDWDY